MSTSCTASCASRRPTCAARFKATKNGKPREVLLSGAARDAMGKPFTTGVMASQRARRCRLAGLRTIGWHIARHSFASHLVMRGVPIRTVQDLMGHASIVITQRYTHLMPGVSHEAVRLLDEPSEGAASAPTPATARACGR